MSLLRYIKQLLPSKKITVFWIGITFIFAIMSLMELQFMTSTHDRDSPHDVEFFERSRLMHEYHTAAKPNNIQQNSENTDIVNIVGLDNIRKELNLTISSLKPLETAPSAGHLVSIPLPQNELCTHKGKVFSLGIMKTGTTSMNAALKTLGYKCHGDSCIHVGNWDFLMDGVHIWQPEEVINLSLIKIPKLWQRYLADSFHGLNFGDSPWCFMYPIFDVLYPNSKFILSKRKSEGTYINSYLKYIQKNKKQYVKQGLTDEVFSTLAIRRYHLHNKMVEKYFEKRANDLLVVTVDEENPESDMMEKLNDFLGCQSNKRFPKKNRAGSRGKQVAVNQETLDWRKVFGINEGDDDYNVIPFLSRQKNHDLQLQVQNKDEFELNFKTFVVEDLQDDISSILET